MSRPCASEKSVVGLVLVVSCAMVASCSSSSLSGKPAPDSGATGGSAATGAGGDPTGGAGDSTGGDGGANGGSGGTAGSVGGTAVISTGGATGGTTSLCNPNSSPPILQCTGTQPLSALISDFSIPAGATEPVAFGPWGQRLTGGAYVYPDAASASDPCASPSTYPLTESFSNGTWHVSGTVGTYSGMGVWWVCGVGSSKYANSCVIDASSYTGISFTVSGDAGPKGTMLLNVATPSTLKRTVDSAGNPTTCGKCSGTCSAALSVPVTPDAVTLSYTWAELGVTEPEAIATIVFQFSDPCNYSTGICVPTPYSVDVGIDDLQFTTH